MQSKSFKDGKFCDLTRRGKVTKYENMAIPAVNFCSIQVINLSICILYCHHQILRFDIYIFFCDLPSIYRCAVEFPMCIYRSFNCFGFSLLSLSVSVSVLSQNTKDSFFCAVYSQRRENLRPPLST